MGYFSVIINKIGNLFVKCAKLYRAISKIAPAKAAADPLYYKQQCSAGAVL